MFLAHFFSEGGGGGEEGEEGGLFAPLSRFLENLKKIEILERERLKTGFLTKPPQITTF